MFRNIKEIYRYRALVGALVTRHLAIRYRGSVLGFLWTLLNPLCLMVVYMLVFKYYIRFSEIPNYNIYLFAGLLPWLWLTSSLNEGTASIVSSGHLITKSMFPAHILPAVSVLTNCVNFLLSLPVLFVIMYFSGAPLHLTSLFIPVLMALEILFLYGVTCGLGALNVRFRDVQHIVGNLLAFVFFLCPILYPPHVVPEQFRFTLDFNPGALFTVAYHSILIDGVLPSAHIMGYISAFVVGALLIGTTIYNRYRETFAELL